MSAVGRPKKPGRRYKNGRLSKEAREATQEDPMATGITARMRHYGVTKDEANEPDKSGKVPWGFALGRLFKRGFIKQPHYLAGNTFGEHMRAYLLSKGIGAPTSPAFDPLRRGASLTESPVLFAPEVMEYLEALTEVDKVNPGRSATFIVMEICLRDGSENLSPRDMGVLREGLNAIGRVLQRRERQAKKIAA